MSASVFRTSDRSTNGSSDVSVDGKKEETKKERKSKLSMNKIIIDGDVEWIEVCDLEPFLLTPRSGLDYTKQETAEYVALI